MIPMNLLKQRQSSSLHTHLQHQCPTPFRLQPHLWRRTERTAAQEQERRAHVRRARSSAEGGPSRRPPTRRRRLPPAAAPRSSGRLRGRSSVPARTSAGCPSGSWRTRSRTLQARAGRCSAPARRTASPTSALPAPAGGSRWCALLTYYRVSQWKYVPCKNSDGVLDHVIVTAIEGIIRWKAVDISTQLLNIRCIESRSYSDAKTQRDHRGSIQTTESSIVQAFTSRNNAHQTLQALHVVDGISPRVNREAQQNLWIVSADGVRYRLKQDFHLYSSLELKVPFSFYDLERKRVGHVVMLMRLPWSIFRIQAGTSP